MEKQKTVEDSVKIPVSSLTLFHFLYNPHGNKFFLLIQYYKFSVHL